MRSYTAYEIRFAKKKQKSDTLKAEMIFPCSKVALQQPSFKTSGNGCKYLLRIFNRISERVAKAQRGGSN